MTTTTPDISPSPPACGVPTSAFPLPTSENPQSEIRNPQSLTPLSPEDQERIETLWLYQGDVVSFITASASDPHEKLLWLAQPHIKPWHDAIAAAYRARRETNASDSLTRALTDIHKVLDLNANPTLQVRAVNSIIKLAHAIYRGSRLSPIPHPKRRRLEQDAQADLEATQIHARRKASAPKNPSRREGQGWVSSTSTNPSTGRTNPPPDKSTPTPLPAAGRAGEGLASDPTPTTDQQTSPQPPTTSPHHPLTSSPPHPLPLQEPPDDPLAPRNWPSHSSSPPSSHPTPNTS